VNHPAGVEQDDDGDRDADQEHQNGFHAVLALSEAETWRAGTGSARNELFGDYALEIVRLI
jgi:hypothetical protein